jgi:hypothetical protein
MNYKLKIKTFWKYAQILEIRKMSEMNFRKFWIFWVLNFVVLEHIFKKVNKKLEFLSFKLNKCGLIWKLRVHGHLRQWPTP